MRLRFYIILILSSCFFSNASAQKVDNDTLINSMKSAITEFFIKQKDLESNQVGSMNAIYATEIKEGKTLGYDIAGIYRIGVFRSHSKEHILVKENSEFKLFDINEIDVVIREAIDFSNQNNIPADTMLFYIKAIIEMYEANNKTATSGGKLKN